MPPVGRDKDGNPEQPIAPWRLPQETIAAIRELKTSMDRLHEITAAKIANEEKILKQNELLMQQKQQGGAGVAIKNAATEGEAKAELPQKPGRASSSASLPMKSMAEISFKEFLRGGIGGIGKGKGFVGGALVQPRTSNLPPYKGGVLGREQDEVEENEKWESDAFPTAESGRSASRPPSEGGRGGKHNAPSFVRGMSVNQLGEMLQEGIKIPQFGEWQLDTAAKMVRDIFAQRASKYGVYNPESEEWNWNAGQEKAGTREANVASLANYGYAHAARLQVLKKAYRGIRGYGENAMNAGAALGYNPQTGIGPAHILGFNNPLSWLTSEAGQQGFGMNLDALETALGTGLSFNQAREAYGAVASQGFSNQKGGFLGFSQGGDLQNIVGGLVGPLIENTGMNPEVAAKFTDQLKTGTASISELTGALKNLGVTARETHKNVNELGEEVYNYGHTATQFGATPVQGYAAGASYARITGLGPEGAGRALENPYFQAQALQSGVLPYAVGTLPGRSVAQLQIKSLHQLMGMFGGGVFGNQKLGPNGEIEPSQQQLALAAHFAGVEPEQAEYLLKNEKKILKAGEAEALGTKWLKNFAGKERSTRNKKQETQYLSELKMLEAHHKGTGKLREEWEAREGKFGEEGEVKLSHGEYMELHREEAPLNQMLKEMHIPKKQREEIYNAHGEKKIELLEKRLAESGEPKVKGAGAANNQVTVGLTKQAEKLLKIESGITSAQRYRNSSGESGLSEVVNTAGEVAGKVGSVAGTINKGLQVIGLP